MRPLREPILVENEYFTLVMDPARVVLRLTRSAKAFSSAADAHAACEPVQVALDAAGRARSCLLVDSRSAPARNDPEYEAWFEPHRMRMIVGFLRVAVLMKSAVGQLQVERYLRATSRGNVRVFVDEKLALAFLNATGSPSTG